MKSRLLLLTFFSIYSMGTIANISLKLNAKLVDTLEQSQISKIESFFAESISNLPQVVKSNLDKIEVNFEMIKNRELPKFSSPQVLREDIWSDGDSHDHEDSHGGSVAYTSKFFGSDITIHSGFLPFIYNDDLKDTLSNNNHKTIYQTAKASLLHEIMHRFDFVKLTPS